MTTILRRLLGTALAIAMASAAVAQEQTQPAGLAMPPAGCTVAPALYPLPGEPPKTQLWAAATRASAWRPPACTGWQDAVDAIVVLVMGSFHVSGGVDDVAHRFGAISSLVRMCYWSTTERRWEALVESGAALQGRDADRPRRDFEAAELVPGHDLYFVQRDNRSSAPVLYRMRILERGTDRIALEVANVSPVKRLFLTLFEPGALQASYFVQRLDGDRWGFLSLSAAHPRGLAAIGDHEGSYLNRALAMYRHIAELPARCR